MQAGARWRERAQKCAAAFADRLSAAPIALPQLACGLHLLTLGHPRQVGAGKLGMPCQLLRLSRGWQQHLLLPRQAEQVHCWAVHPRLHPCAACHALQVVVAGPRGAPDTEALLDAVFHPFAPGAWLAGWPAELCRARGRAWGHAVCCWPLACPPSRSAGEAAPAAGSWPALLPTCLLCCAVLCCADKVVIQLDLSDAALTAFWRAHNPEALAVAEAAGAKAGGAATAYVCQNFTCKAPTSDPGKVSALLAQPRSGPAPAVPADLSGLGRRG